MGLSYLVYPGAHHTRFHHAIGCMHLMQKAVQVLRFKGIKISKESPERKVAEFEFEEHQVFGIDIMMSSGM